MTQFLTRLLFIAITAGTIGLTAGQAVSAQDKTIEDLAKKLPASINSIMSVNVDRIKNSALGIKEGWGNTHAGKVSSGLIFVPEEAKLVLMGAVMDFDAFHARQTSILVTMAKVPELSAIRQVTDGTVDELQGYQIVETKNDSYVVPLSDTLVAGLRPALRSYFGKWLGDLRNDTPTRVPDYLEEGLSYADEFGTEVILAFNMKHTISRSRVMDRIRDNEVVRENSLDPRVVSKLIASARGFTLGITVTDQVYGAVKIDFTEDISSLKPIASDLAHAVLNRSGLHLDEFATWKVDSGTNQVKLSGSMSVESLRKILSLVDAGQHENTVATTDASGSSNYNDPGMAAKRYFDTVNSFVKQVQPKLSAGNAYTRNANWLKQYADKIGAMGTLNVDTEMIDYGNYVSQSLRDASMMLIETNETSKEKNRNLIAAGARSGGAGGRGGWGHSYNRYGWYGGGSGYRRRVTGGDGSRLRSAVRQNEKGQAVQTAKQIFNDLSAAEIQVRQEMTAKYNFQF